MTNRIRTQKKIYTPTTTTVEPESFLCQIIETGEYVIVHRSSMKRIYDNTAEIMVRGRRTEAKIEFRGTYVECQRKLEKKEEIWDSNDFDEANCSENEEDENENDDTPIEILTSFSSSKIPTKCHTPQQKRSPLASTIQNNHRSSRLHTAKRIKQTDFEKELQGDDILNDGDNDNQYLTSASGSCLMKHMNIQFNSMRQENQQQFLQLSKKIDQKHHIESMDLSSFRTPGCNHTSDEPVMYEKINLLTVRGKNVGDYARQILRIIFTHEELTTSILPPGGTHYSRKTLDKEKFKLFDDAMRSKYRIDQHRYDDFFTKLVRPKLVDFLVDERKRDRKRHSMNSSLTSSLDRNSQ